MSSVPASTSLHRSATTPSSSRTNNSNAPQSTTKGSVQVHQQSYEATSNGRHHVNNGGPERVQQLNRSVTVCDKYFVIHILLFALFLFE